MTSLPSRPELSLIAKGKLEKRIQRQPSAEVASTEPLLRFNRLRLLHLPLRHRHQTQALDLPPNLAQPF